MSAGDQDHSVVHVRMALNLCATIANCLSIYLKQLGTSKAVNSLCNNQVTLIYNTSKKLQIDKQQISAVTMIKAKVSVSNIIQVNFRISDILSIKFGTDLVF